MSWSAVEYVSQYLDNQINMLYRHIWIEWERQIRVANSFSDRERAWLKPECVAEICEQMNSAVIDHHADAVVLQLLNHQVALSFTYPNGKKVPGVINSIQRLRA